MNPSIRVLVAMSVLASCAAELKTTAAVTAVGEPSGAAAMTTIGAAGGTVRSADGKVELIIPAGALAADTAMSVTPLSVTAPGGVKAWRLGPEGTTFERPASLKVTFTEAELSGSTTDALKIAFQDAQRRWQAIKTSTIDAQSITVETTHLSDWSLLLGWQLRPPAASVQPNKTLSLSVRFCNAITNDKGTDLELVSLVAECQEDEGLAPIIGSWAVNGVTGGSLEFGTVQPGSPTAVFTAPGQAPSGGSVAVSVEFNPPATRKTLLVSNITIGDTLPRGYGGTVGYHLKLGGPNTSILSTELRATAQLTLRKAASGTSSYDLSGGTASLVSYDKQTDLAGCHCTASNIAGTVEANTGALILDTSDGVLSAFQWSARFTVPLICTGSADPSCANMSSSELVVFVLGGMNPACAGSSSLTFTDPRVVNGSWNTTCPANPQVVGRIEESTWALQGD